MYCCIRRTVLWFSIESFFFLNTELKQWPHKQFQHYITQNVYSSWPTSKMKYCVKILRRLGWIILHFINWRKNNKQWYYFQLRKIRGLWKDAYYLLIMKKEFEKWRRFKRNLYSRKALKSEMSYSVRFSCRREYCPYKVRWNILKRTAALQNT